MNKCCELNNKGTKGFSPEFIESLMTYDWPGNVRELINTIESAITTAEDYPILLPRHLPTYIRVKMARESVLKHARINREPKNDGSNSQVIEKFKQFRQKAVAEAEKMYLYNLISITRWNIKEAGRLSGLSQARLYGLLKKHAITKID